MRDDFDRRARRLRTGRIIKPVLGIGIALVGLYALFELVRKLEAACGAISCPNSTGEILVVAFCCILAGVGAATMFKALFEQS
jgi:hypothetical protein